MPTLADLHKAKISGSGEEIVLLGHGFGTDQTVWHNLEPLLLRRRYRVMLYNLMGQGTGVPTGFSSTSLGHSAGSKMSGDSHSSDSPRAKKHGSAIERATSDVANEEFERELKALQLNQQGSIGVSKRGLFGRKINESFSRLFKTSKRKSNDRNGTQQEERPIEPRAENSQEGANEPASRDPEFSGRRDFQIQDLDRGEDERPERIDEEETEGIVSAEDFNYSRYTSLDAFAEDLINLMDEMGVKQCVYVGHSVSGMIGLLASVKRPDLFKKLVLLTTSPRYLDDGDYIGGFKDEDIDNLLASIKTNYKAWVQGFAPVAIHTSNNEAVADYMEGLLDVRPDVAYCILSTIFRSDYRQLLPEVSVPCHVLVSNNDVAVPLQVGEYMHRHLRNSALEILSTHGHLPHLSSPMLVNAALIKHIEQPP